MTGAIVIMKLKKEMTKFVTEENIKSTSTACLIITYQNQINGNNTAVTINSNELFFQILQIITNR